jgi:hypothetical protein
MSAKGWILLQKSPQTLCEIRIGNNRIDAGEYLNQCCASAPQLESILRGQMGKIFLQQYRVQSGLVVLKRRLSGFDLVDGARSRHRSVP